MRYVESLSPHQRSAHRYARYPIVALSNRMLLWFHNRCIKHTCLETHILRTHSGQRAKRVNCANIPMVIGAAIRIPRISGLAFHITRQSSARCVRIPPHIFRRTSPHTHTHNATNNAHAHTYTSCVCLHLTLNKFGYMCWRTSREGERPFGRDSVFE